MQTANHILAKEGILTTFSIAKKITEKDVNRLRSKMKTSRMDAKKLQEMLKMSVIEETKSAIESKKIPGLILDGMIADTDEKKRIMELTYFSSIIAKKLTDKNIDKYHSCYIINAIVNILGLTEEDFDEFHRKFSKFREGTDNPNEEGLDGDGLV